MKKFFLFCGVICAMLCVADAFSATKVLMPKKADAVAKRDTTTTTSNSAASLASTAVNLVGTAVALSRQQKALVAECEPDAKDVAFVNEMVKEWANAGAANPMKSKSRAQCGVDSNSPNYQSSVLGAIDGSSVDSARVCWDVFTEAEARGAVWAGFPKAAVADVCGDGTGACAKNSRKKYTNLWDIWAMIPFEDKDFTKSESSRATALNEKAKKCSPAKLAEKRMEQLGGFVLDSVGNIGQKTNTGSIMETVQSVVGNTSLGGTLGGVAPILGQFLDK